MGTLARTRCAAVCAVAATVFCPTAQAQSEDQTLSLGDVVRRVLDHNPQLRAAAHEVRSATARRDYAGRFINPTVSLELEDFLGSGHMAGFAGAETTLRLSQTFEIGGQRGARSEVAQSALSEAEADRAVHRTRALAETVLRFWHVAADQHRLRVATDAEALAAHGVKFAALRSQSGAASALEERRANIALARSRIRLEHAEHELRASRRRLSMMWGDTGADFGPVDADLFREREVGAYETLAARIEGNPQLVRLTRAQAVQRAEMALAESEAFPDLSITLGARRTEAPEAFGVVLGVGVPIPIFDRNRGATGAAEGRTDEVGALREAHRVQLLATLFGYLQELSHAKEELHVLSREILPNAESVLELTTLGFRSGRFSQIELLDAQRTLIELQGERIDAAEEMCALSVRIKALIGADPHEVIGDRDETAN